MARALCIFVAGLVWIAPLDLIARDVEWRAFHPPKQSFTVQMPAKLRRSRRTTRTIVGSVKTDVWAAHLELSRLSVSITHLPRIATWFTDDDDLYEKAIDKMMEELGAQLGRVEEVERGPFERKIFFRVPALVGKPLWPGRALLGVDDRIIVVVTAFGPADGVDLDAFFRGISPQPPVSGRVSWTPCPPRRAIPSPLRLASMSPSCTPAGTIGDEWPRGNATVRDLPWRFRMSPPVPIATLSELSIEDVVDLDLGGALEALFVEEVVNLDLDGVLDGVLEETHLLTEGEDGESVVWEDVSCVFELDLDPIPILEPIWLQEAI